ncbi:MAG: hypothetical protein KIT16_08950 [Rhodospirillaceae bacterium]|nr:hypothetical protein [Rhodospirillaceae bacterium]
MAVVSHDDESAGGPFFVLIGLLLALALAVLLVIVWSALSVGVARSLAPAPLDALREFLAMLGDPAAWRNTAASLGAWLAAFVVAGFAAIAIGSAAGRFGKGGRLLAPALWLFGAFPAVALAPLGILAFGMKSHVPAIAVSAALAFFPAVAVIAHGMAAPGARARTNAILRGLEIAALLALFGVVFTEMLFGTDNLGSAIIAAAQSFQTVKLYAQILWLWMVGAALALPFAVLRWAVGRQR